jgi:RNase H-fold protein (predicted Holliday junction resolvase)
MFEKLFLLVKNNAGVAVMNNPVIPAGSREAVINEASSSIIEVLKNQMESGHIKDVIKYFQFSGTYNESMVTSMINKFANRINKFYSIDMASAQATANSLIPAVMKQLVQQSNSKQTAEFALGTMLSKLNGNQADLNGLVNKLMVA